MDAFDQLALLFAQIKQRSTSNAVDAWCDQGLAVVAQARTLAPQIVERRSGTERRQHREPDAVVPGERTRAAGRRKSDTMIPIIVGAVRRSGSSGGTIVPPPAATKLGITTQPTSAPVNDTAFAQQPVIQLQDSGSSPISQAGIVVTAAIASGSMTLGGTLTATTNSSGVATFTNLKLTGMVEACTIGFTAPGGLTGVTSNSVTPTAGSATTITANSATDQSATVSTAVSVPPSVIVTDVSGNPVSGASVTPAVASGGGTVVPTGAQTTASDGTYTTTSWTLGSSPGANSVTVTSAGLTGSPVTFTATGQSAGSASALNAASTVYPLVPVAIDATGIDNVPAFPQLHVNTAIDTDFLTGGSSTVLTVSGTGSSSNIATHMATWAAGSGKYTIIIPDSVTLLLNSISVPAPTNTSGLYIMGQETYDGTAVAEGTRVTAATASSNNYPKITTNASDYGLALGTGTKNVRFVGIEFERVAGGASATSDLVRLTGGSTVATQPTNIVFDRCYFHGGSGLKLKNAITLNGNYCAVVECCIDDVFYAGVESHGIVFWSNAGPVKIDNNYIAAASINILIGGADPSIAGLSPSDIVIRRNHIDKDTAWVGQGFVEKNLIELKHAMRVLIEGNRMSHAWVDAQPGHAFRLQSSTDNPGAAPQTQTCDVVIRYNHISDVNEAVNISAHGWNGSGVALARVLIEDNWFDDVGDAATPKAFAFSSDIRDLTIRGNTVRFIGSGVWMGVEGSGAVNFAFLNNITNKTTSSGLVIKKSGISAGVASLNSWAAGPEWTYTGNVHGSVPSSFATSARPVSSGSLNDYSASEVTIAADGRCAAFPTKGANMDDVELATSGVS